MSSLKRGFGRSRWFAGGAAAVVLLALIAGWIGVARNAQRPQPWHEFNPDEEFDVGASDAASPNRIGSPTGLPATSAISDSTIAPIMKY